MHAIKALGTVVESLLGVLGFQPVESLVVVAVKSGEVGCVMRLDLSDAALADAPDRLAELAVRSGADGVVAVVVSAEGAGCRMCGDQFGDLARGASPYPALKPQVGGGMEPDSLLEPFLMHGLAVPPNGNRPMLAMTDGYRPPVGFPSNLRGVVMCGWYAGLALQNFGGGKVLYCSVFR
jgi:hypothetical protein